MSFLAVSCESLMPIINVVKGLLQLIRWGIPIALLLFGTIDLGKAVIASKEDEIKNAQKLLVKRALYAVVIFLVPFIVEIVFGLLDDNTWAQCWNQVEK